MLKGYRFYITVFFLLVIIALLSYFVAVNLIFKDKILAPVDIFGESISISADETIESQISLIVYSKLPEKIIFEYGGKDFEFSKFDIKLDINSKKIRSYGKGKDFIKVFSEGIQLVTNSKEISTDEILNYNITDIYKKFDIQPTQSINSTVIFKDSSLNISNCESQKIYISMLKSQLNQSEIEGIILSGKYKFPLTEDEETLINSCRKYLTEKPQIEKVFGQNINAFSIKLDYSGNPYWFVSNYDFIYDYLNSKSQENLVYADSGVYEIHGDKIYLFEKYTVGRQLNFSESLNNITRWLTNPSDDLILVYDEVKPEILKLNKEILDFTKLMASGKTRIEIYRNGTYNYGLERGQDGIMELQNAIIQPGQEFSYINHIKPQPNGLSINGRAIGSGICNATTTLFRAALESGLPITDRSYHAHNYDSYSWPYPLNIVDAAYLTSPVVDLKFINDTKYPILMRTKIERPGDNWQYHTVSFYTSSESPYRKVELYDWKKWNVYSPGNFEGSFRRKVTEGDKIIRDDEFYSKYW